MENISSCSASHLSSHLTFKMYKAVMLPVCFIWARILVCCLRGGL